MNVHPDMSFQSTGQKQTQNRYVPSIITECAAIGEEQCTGNCNFIF